jgi:hypothetical protein
MQSVSEYTVNGKTLPLYSRKQLESMSPQIMRLRALDIKDAVGVDMSVPRHKDTLLDWILDMQNTLLEQQGTPFHNESARAAQPDTREQMAAGLSRNAGSQPSNFLAHPEYSQSEAGEVEGYAQTRSDAMRARVRNQGSGNILSWA